MLNRPFQFTSHNQLGKENSLLSARKLGAAKVDVAVNVGTGNVCVTDVELRFQDKGMSVELAAVYNSLNREGTAWRIAHGRQLKMIAPEKSLVAMERDGREVAYTFDDEKKQYIAKENGRDRAYLHADGAGFARYDLESQVTDYFDAAGLLQKQVDAAGLVTSYEYDAKGELSAILPPSGVRYELMRENQQVSLYLRDRDKFLFLHRYTFDAGLTSETYDGYKVNYQTDANGQLAKISQSDGSVLDLAYIASGEHQHKLESIKTGASDAATIHYEATCTTVTDAAKDAIQFTLNEAKRAVCVATPSETTGYQYTADGQIETIDYADNSQEQFTYQAYGLPATQQERDGQVHVHHYSEGEKPLLIAKEIRSQGTAVKTQLVYERDLLRFKISPSGKVTAYAYDEEGLLHDKKEYTQTKWDMAQNIGLPALLAWENEQQALRGDKAFVLQTYSYNERGQLKCLTQGALTNQQNKAIQSTSFDYDDYGNTKQQTLLCESNKQLITDFTYNSLHQITNEITGANTAIAQQTTTRYSDNTVTQIAANKKETVNEKDAEGRIIRCIEKADSETRTSFIDYVNSERAVKETRPDKQIILNFFDDQNRLTAHLSPSGALTSHTYLDNVRCHIQTDYAQVVLLDNLLQASQPSNVKLQATLATLTQQAENRKCYTFMGLNNKPQYDIDAAGFMTEYRYDIHDHRQHLIQYKTKITAEELQQLLQGENLKRLPDRAQDRVQSSFTDTDGEEIAAQDPNGYVTEWKRDAAGRPVEKIVYKNNNLVFADDVQQIRPTVDAAEDARTYYFYNELNQIKCEVDAEGFITEFTYYADGKIENQIRYADKVTSEWFATHQDAPLPAKSAYDFSITYEYDELRRLIATEDSTGKKTTYAYNESNKQTANIQKDTRASSLNGDTQRGTQMVYDTWNQTHQAANAFVAQALALSDEEKKESLWQNESLRSTFDETGLLLKTINETGVTTLYFYNRDRKPVLTIQPSGAFKTYQYNVFGELIEKRQSYKRLETTLLAKLTGGFLEDNLKTTVLSLQDNSRDEVMTYARDERGLITKKTNPSGYISQYEYNAFKLCDKKYLPVNEKTPSLTVNQQFDLMGNLIETIKSSPQTSPIKTSQVYGRFNALVEETNELGCHQKNNIDRLGHVTEKHVSTEPGVYLTVLKQTLNAQGKPVSITRADQQTTHIEHDPNTRTKLIHHPDGTSKTRLTLNIFGEVIEKEKGYFDADEHFQPLQKEKITHAPDGQVAEKYLGDNKIAENQHYLDGQLKSELVNGTLAAAIDYDQDGLIQTRTVQASHDSYKTTYGHNALGKLDALTDAKQFTKTFQHDLNTNTETVTTDPTGLSLTTTQCYNANQQALTKEEGSTQDKQQYCLSKSIDQAGHITTSTIDPAGLRIQKSFEYDALGHMTKETDPNGHAVRHYFDLQGRKRFTIKDHHDTECAVIQYDYTPSGQLNTTRTYAHAIARTSIDSVTDLAAVAALLNASNDDTITRYFYNANGQEQFKLELLYAHDTNTYQALVEEKQYDAAQRPNKTTLYADAIDASDWQTLTLTQVAERTIVCSHENDRITHRWHDLAGRERFTIDQDGHVTAYQYNAAGKIIAATRHYQTLTADASLSLADIEKSIQHSPQDRTDYAVYDELGRLLFDVKSNLIKAYGYDKNNNKTLFCTFKDPAPAVKNHDELVALLSFITPEHGKDNIIEYVYDHANRLTDEIEYIIQKTTDGKEEVVAVKNHYDLNDVGEIKVHIDKEGNKWQYTVNKAKRVTDKLSPPVAVATPYFVPGDKKELAYNETITPINKHNDHDAAGNIICSTEASNTSSARSFYTQYDAAKKITQTELKNVDVDNGSTYAPSWDGLKTLPVTQQTITTRFIYNTKGKKIASKNENDDWTYFVYDSLERLTFLIGPNNQVVRYAYNAFNEVTQEWHYDTPLTLDLSPYQQNSVPVDLISAALKEDDHDQVKDYQHDRQGKVTQIASRAVFYYSDGESGTAKPTTMQRFNVFNEIIHEAKLIRPNVWAEKFYWRNEAGQVIAEVDENLYVTRYKLDAAGLITEKHEYLTPLAKSPLNLVVKQNIAELDALIIESEEDRVYQYTYTASGLKKSEKLLGVITHEFRRDKDNVPYLVEMPPVDLIKEWEHTPRGLESCYIDESGNKTYKIHDAREQLIAEKLPSYVKQDDVAWSWSRDNYIHPLIVYKKNEFGQTVVMQTSPSGWHDQLKENTYTPIQGGRPAEEVTETIALFDNRGLLNYKQDAEKNLIAKTYTGARQCKREIDLLPVWHPVSSSTALIEDEWVDVKDDEAVNAQEKFIYQGAEKGWQSAAASASVTAEKPKFISISHIAEKRHDFDPTGHETKTSYYLEGHTEAEISRVFSSSATLIAETDDKHPEGLIRKVDAAGRAWYTNENKGAKSIQLYDLLGRSTLNLAAAEKDLSAVSYADLPDLLKEDINVISRTEMLLDAIGNVIGIKSPRWFRTKPTLLSQQSTFDRYRNAIQTISALGRIHAFKYNKLNKLAEHTEPEMAVVNAADQLVRLSPTTLYGYDRHGNEIGVRDANGHTSAAVYDEIHRLIKKIEADGVIKFQYYYDAIDRIKKVLDSRGNPYIFIHNKINQSTKAIMPSNRAIDRTFRGERGISSQTDSLGQIDRYNTNVRGRAIEEHIFPKGEIDRTIRDLQEYPILEQRADGSSYHTGRTYFGPETDSSDFENRLRKLFYNHNMQLIRSLRLSPSHWPMLFVTPVLSSRTRDGFTFPFWTYLLSEQEAPIEDIQMAYEDKLLISTTNMGDKRKSVMRYNEEDLRIELSTYELNGDKEKLLYSLNTEYNEAKLPFKTSNKYLTLSQQYAEYKSERHYDAVHNYCRARMELITPGISSDYEPLTQAVNLAIYHDLADHILRQSASWLTPNFIGHSEMWFRYVAGLRKVEGICTDDSKKKKETNIDYTEDGLLKALFDNDDLLLTLSYRNGYPNSIHKATDGHQFDRSITPDANGFPALAEEKVDGILAAQTKYETNPIGLPIKSVSNSYETKHGDWQAEDTRTNEYLSTNSSKLKKSSVTRRTHKQGPLTEAHYGFNSEGNHNGKMGSEDEAGTEDGDAKKNNAIYETSADHTIENKLLVPTKDSEGQDRYHLTQFVKNTSGEIEGCYLNHYEPYYIWLEHLLHGETDPKTTEYKSSYYSYKGYTPLIPHFPLRLVGERKVDKDKPLSSPFNWSYALPIELGPQPYTVQTGDTLLSIAREQLGDSDFAEHLGLLNGILITDQNLKPGMVLQLPKLIPNRNNAEASTPYHEFMARIIGSLSPNIITPEPKKPHIKWFSIIAKLIVVAVISIFLPEFIGPAISMLGLGGLSGTAAIVTKNILSGIFLALSDGAAQVTVDGRVSTTEMFEVGASAIIQGSLPDFTGLATLDAALKVAITTTSTQLMEMQLNLRDKFDARSIGVQITASLIHAKVAPGSLNLSYLEEAFEIAIDTATNAGLHYAFYGTRPDYQYLAANAIGSFISQEIVKNIVPNNPTSTTEPPTHTAPTPNKKPTASSSRFFQPQKSQPAKVPVSSHEETQTIDKDFLNRMTTLPTSDPEIYLIPDYCPPTIAAQLPPEPSTSVRIFSALQAIDSAKEIAIGAGLSLTGIGALLGVPLMASGADNLYANYRSMLSGQPEETYFVKLATEHLGLNETEAEWLQGGLDSLGGGGLGKGTTKIAGSRLSMFGDEATVIGTRAETIPDLGRPFRTENPLHPSNPKVIEHMNRLPLNNTSLDCSEITDKLFNIGGNTGNKLKITPKTQFGQVTVPERAKGKIEGISYDYHYVYQEKGYIYDPRASSLPMPKGDYFKLVKQYNPSGFILEEELNNMMGVNLRRIKP